MGFKDVLENTPNIIINNDAIKFATLREIIPTEREHEYRKYIELLIKYLPENERKDCAKNPIDFVSADLLFRGITSEGYEEIKLTKSYPVQKGQFGEAGVFFSNNPYTAFTYTAFESGVIAVIDKEKLVYKDNGGIIEVGSEEYKNGINALLSFLAEKGTESKDTLYTINNFWDLSVRGHGANPLARIITMRLSQPITATKAFIVLKDGAHEESSG